MDQTTTDRIIAALERHPRIAYQQILRAPDQLSHLRESLPEFTPFGGVPYAGFIAVLDWDHRMPTLAPVLRIMAYTSDTSLQQGRDQFQRRTAEIRSHDAFPEFDVGDYSDVSGDEVYEAILDRSGAVTQIRLASDWRREIETDDAYAAIEVVRQSTQFHGVAEPINESRAAYLGDLEAVSWTPPCETQYPRWTIDVWYVEELDMSQGRGHSFLVDPKEKKVVSSRQFVVRQ